MIARLASFLLIAWALGFALFAVTLGKPAPADVGSTQAIIVLTGGKYRIEHAAKLLGERKATRLLIAGAGRAAARLSAHARWLEALAGTLFLGLGLRLMAGARPG